MIVKKFIKTVYNKKGNICFTIGNVPSRPTCEFHSCPQGCDCKYDGLVDCTRGKLTSIPNVLPKNVEIL